jgi:hypothetical protein
MQYLSLQNYQTEHWSVLNLKNFIKFFKFYYTGLIHFFL